MDFPFWINNERNKEKAATLRLKYMLNIAAVNRYGRASMHDLAKDVPCNHSSIFNAIARGYFTTTMAEGIEAVFGKKVLPAAYLTDPMQVGKEVA